MLQKQKISDNDHYDLPLIYSVNGHTLHFGRREFCLISGFKFRFLSFRKFREGDITFRDRVFPKKIGEYLKNIDLLSLIEDEYRFSSLLSILYRIWNLESSVWTDVAKKPDCDLYPNKCEAQSEWFKKSTDFFKMYTPRAPPVEYGGLFGAYLKKLSLARKHREKMELQVDCQTSTIREVSLKDRVRP
ncbi:hypothetical protein Tco_0777900 [Tanacetum coccineum]